MPQPVPADTNTGTAVVADPSAIPVAPAEISAEGLLRVPALTPVRLQLREPISSNTNRPGDRFKLVVAEDVVVDEAVVIPAGAAAEGEVIHAAKSGAGGKAGELILAARFVTVGTRQVRLRSFIAGAGKDRTTEALATSIVAGPFALFLRGGVINIPVDTAATAKTLDTVFLPPIQPRPAPAVTPTTPTSISTGE